MEFWHIDFDVSYMFENSIRHQVLMCLRKNKPSFGSIGPSKKHSSFWHIIICSSIYGNAWLKQTPGGAWGSGHTTGGDDGWGPGREHAIRMVGGHGRAEQDAWAAPSGNRVGVRHGARIENEACWLHKKGSGGADGMRGNGMGVGDTSEVPGDV